VQVDSTAAAARLLVEVCQTEDGNIVKDAHLGTSGEGTTAGETVRAISALIDLPRTRRICFQP
jgi:hypothetical protein